MVMNCRPCLPAYSRRRRPVAGGERSATRPLSPALRRAWRRLPLLLVLCLLPLGLSARTTAERHGWRLAVQSYTYHTVPFVDALRHTRSLGVKYIEIYPGHQLGGPWGKTAFGPETDRATARELARYALRQGVRIVGTGVLASDRDEDYVKLFRLAHDMRLSYVTCEPLLRQWPLVDSLARHYGLRVAVHNHPKPSLYWQPQALLDAIGKLGPHVGSCADVGHWRREGMSALDCLRQLNGRIISLHFKDIVAGEGGAKGYHDTVWGQGILDMPALLAELKAQHFKGYLAIEYEYHWGQADDEIRQSIDAFNAQCDALWAR